ncbi:hypothetical protein BGO17_02735 [Candidatus Saccharibacteria bacterium 49-20]|nr:MAG: hypothetical protein BGO17_02735 [Candidatus Saccharibacteria bacterium 49-20]
MLRFLAITVLTLLGNALGLIIASWILDGFNLTVVGFTWSVIFFTIAQLILTPFVLSMSLRYLPALRGGIALVTTFVVLWLTTLFTSGVEINGLATWILAPLIIWLVTVLAGVVSPLFIFKKTMSKVKDSKAGDEIVS